MLEKIPDFIIKLLKKFNNKKKYFLIFSTGGTATRWIAISLSKHKDVFCAHSYFYPPEEESEEVIKKWTKEKDLEKSRLIKNRFSNITSEEYFKELESATSKKNVGSINLYTIGSYSNFPKELKEKIKVAHIYRNPVCRIQSIHEHQLKMYKLGDNNVKLDVMEWFETERTQEGARNHLKNKGYEVDFNNLDNVFFLSTVGIIKSATGNILEAFNLNIPQFSYEDLTTSKAAQNALFKTITGKNLDKDIFLSGKINNHRTSFLGPKDQFESWEDWKKELFRFSFEVYKELYVERLSYDLSFVWK